MNIQVGINNMPQNYLREWRKHKGMTQETLATEAGTTKSMISLYENGNRAISFRLASTFAGILDTTAAAIMGYAPDSWEANISKILQQIPEDRRRQFLDVAKTFTSK
ncbi:MAG: helix-turn-helix transcriptional regulator [Rhizomicrobium sp.]